MNPNNNPSIPFAHQPDPSASPLLQAFLAITASWREVFAQARTFRRALRQALGGLLCVGRRTVTRILWANGRDQEPWAAEYFLHSQSPWQPQSLFDARV
jgi:hypothetical protein